MDAINVAVQHREPWNKGKLVGQKTPFKLKRIWAIRIRLQIANRIRDLALFDLAIDSKPSRVTLIHNRSPNDRPSAPGQNWVSTVGQNSIGANTTRCIGATKG